VRPGADHITQRPRPPEEFPWVALTGVLAGSP
jgi:hypothetical protein